MDSYSDLESTNEELDSLARQRQGGSEATQAIETFKGYRGVDEVVEFSALTTELGKIPPPEYLLFTGLPTLDLLIDGFHPGELVVISAPTGNGKTKLCETLTVNMGIQGHYSLWFTFEMPPLELGRRFGDKIPMFYLPRINTSTQMTWIEQRIAEGIAKYGIKSVFIDHLHYLFDLSAVRNPSLQLGVIVRQIKKLALKYGITIFLVAHMAKVSFDKKITLNDIRDSSFVAQEADYVLMLSREMVEDASGSVIFGNKTKISVQKNRRTGKSGGLIAGIKDGIFIEYVTRPTV